MYCEDGNDIITPVTTDSPHAELAAVEAQMSRISVTLQRLLTKTHVLKSRINDIDSPFLRLLPAEIISAVFEFCTPSWTLYNDTSNCTHEPYPLKLGSICTRLRRIAWRTPTLWASLSLYITTKNCASQILLLDEWISRSGDLPLLINLSSEDEQSWSEPDAPTAAVEVIKKYSSRWRWLHLQLPTSCYASLPGPETLLPLLTALHIDPAGGQTERRHKVDMSHASQIKYLGLSCVYLTSMVFQFDQVTHLTLQSFYVDECLQVLSQSPQIVDCRLKSFIDGDDGHILPFSPVTLPALKRLTLDNVKDTPIASLLQTIRIPNAIELTYSGRNLIHITQLCALISRSTSLRTFSLLGTFVSSENIFLQLLTALKSIKEFNLDVVNVHGSNTSSPLTDRILQQCNPSAAELLGTDCLLPALETFKYSGAQIFSWPEFISTIKSRSHSNQKGLEGTSSQQSINAWRTVELRLTRLGSNISKPSADLMAQLEELTRQLTLMLHFPQESGDQENQSDNNIGVQ
jgi:hypothetical protein